MSDERTAATPSPRVLTTRSGVPLASSAPSDVPVRIWRLPEPIWKRLLWLPLRCLGAFLANGSGPYD